jgi:hypothetical protein
MKLLFVSLCVLVLGACVSDEMQGTARGIFDAYMNTNGGTASSLSVEQVTLGLKEALNVGSKNVTTRLHQAGGFNRDPNIRIPLPDALNKVHVALDSVGMGGMTADLETRMNAAAERAAGEVYPLFVDAIKQMTIADARGILSGQQDAATQYLRRTMGAALEQKINPIVGSALAQAGAVQAYDRVMGQYASLPFVSNVKTDMNNYVTGKAVDGIFHYIAQEEAAIRQNPAKRTTEILRTVFGAQ